MAVLCFGDTGPDAVERSTHLSSVWAAVAERVKQKRLKAIVIESSFTSDRPDNLLFGHLTPHWVLEELRALDRLAGGDALNGLPVVVSHIKYSLTTEQPQKQMLQELEAGNDLACASSFPSREAAGTSSEDAASLDGRDHGQAARVDRSQAPSWRAKRQMSPHRKARALNVRNGGMGARPRNQPMSASSARSTTRNSRPLPST